MKINLNEPVKVKLTDWGKEIFYHQYDRVNKVVGREVCKPRYPKEDENGYTEFQLWCFMELYGEHMGMTLPNVIEPLEIVYESEPERKKGKWIPMQVSSGRDSWKCSVCGRRARGKLENLPYCHCGAKMEEKK